jgi:SAM-dependent methyltransferase
MKSISIEALIVDHMEPTVPAELMRYTCALENQTDFVRTGAEVFTMLDLAAQKHEAKSIRDFRSILDFGCGNGRVLRFFDEASSKVWGCDVNALVIEFAASNFPSAHLYHSPLLPPLEYETGAFDLIFSFSVFSHLSLDVERVWLAELARVAAPDCLFLLSIHGEWWIEATQGERTKALRAAGFTWEVVHGRKGVATDFPDYYEVSFHTSSYIRQNWSEYFEILDVVKGDNPMRYVEHDSSQAYLASQIRPMGQDLVIARAR